MQNSTPERPLAATSIEVVLSPSASGWRETSPAAGECFSALGDKLFKLPRIDSFLPPQMRTGQNADSDEFGYAWIGNVKDFGDLFQL